MFSLWQARIAHAHVAALFPTKKPIGLSVGEYLGDVPAAMSGRAGPNAFTITEYYTDPGSGAKWCYAPESGEALYTQEKILVKLGLFGN